MIIAEMWLKRGQLWRSGSEESLQESSWNVQNCRGGLKIIYSTKFQIPNFEYQIPKFKYQIPNSKKACKKAVGRCKTAEVVWWLLIIFTRKCADYWFVIIISWLYTDPDNMIPNMPWVEPPFSYFWKALGIGPNRPDLAFYLLTNFFQWNLHEILDLGVSEHLIKSFTDNQGKLCFEKCWPKVVIPMFSENPKWTAPLSHAKKVK